MKFQDRFIAEDRQIVSLGRLTLNVHLEIIEKLTAIDDASFAPSAEAVLLPVIAPSEVTPGLILHKIEPIYPAGARLARIQGTVVIEATISKAGHIESMHLIAGPSMLQKAALNAVNQWTYKPYLLNGTPLEERTTILVVFAL